MENILFRLAVNDPVQFVGFKKADATGEIKNIALGTRNAED